MTATTVQDEECKEESLTVTLEEYKADEALDHILRGMMFASLAITDDKNLTLAKVGKANPWHIEALKLIVGNEEQAHRPLSDILKTHMDLVLDTHIDITGITKGMHFLDTQGYIAHNDSVIVLSYRCTTSILDWLTNLNMTMSAWEVEEDLELGFSGYCSGLEGLCCGERKPRVHTGFYNNFLATLPMIKTHIEPLLGPDQPPRTLYVCGHSLGAGVATVAACHFLLEYDWDKIPHSFCAVTAGSPRSVGRLMRDLVEERISMFKSAHVYRLVKGKDVVTTVPPTAFGFRHITEAVRIEDDGKINLNVHIHSHESNEKDRATTSEIKVLVQGMKDESPDPETASDYDKFVAKVPAGLRDHMPDFYLKPLLQARGMMVGSSESSAITTNVPAPQYDPSIKRLLAAETAN